MAAKNQIKLVKASHCRIKDLLEGTGIEARVSYTSASDTLKIVFSKRYKRLGASLEFTRCTSLRQVSTNSGIIENIVREMTHEMATKKEYHSSPEAFCAELESLASDYSRSVPRYNSVGWCIRVAGNEGIHIVVHGGTCSSNFNMRDGKGSRYGIYPLPVDYEAAEAYFVNLMDQCSDGGYSRWVAAGMPKKSNPVQAPVIPQSAPYWAELFRYSPSIGMATNSGSMRFITVDSLGGVLPSAQGVINEQT
jgi:hypothetical protein